MTKLRYVAFSIDRPSSFSMVCHLDADCGWLRTAKDVIPWTNDDDARMRKPRRTCRLCMQRHYGRRS